MLSSTKKNSHSPHKLLLIWVHFWFQFLPVLWIWTHYSSSPLDTASMDTAAPSLAPANPDIRDSSSPISPQQSSIFRRSTRRKKLPSYLKDYHCNLHQSVPQSNLSSASIPAPSSDSHSLSKVLSYESLSTPHKTFSVKLTTNFEPRSYEEAARYHLLAASYGSRISCSASQ